MIWTIVKREVLDNLMSLRLLFGTVLCLALVVISALVCLQDYQGRMDDYSNTLAQFNEESNVWNVKILKKPEVLSIFVRGFDDRLGNVANSVLDHFIPVTSDLIGSEEEGQSVADLTSIDLLFVVRVFITLLAIFLSYDAISGEYERGTLRLMLSRPVSRASIILGKLIAGLMCLLIPLLISFIIGVLIAQLGSGVNFTSEEWLRVTLIFVASTLCVSSFYMLGLVVSSKTRQAATSLLILLLIWLTSVFLIPGMTTAIIGRYRLMTPHPDSNISAIYEDFWQNNPMPLEKMIREEWNRKTTEWQERSRSMYNSVWNIQEQYLNRLYSQADLARWICRSLPSESFAYAAEAMARTDTEAYKNFMNYVRSYHKPQTKLLDIAWMDSEKFREEGGKYNKAVQAPPLDFAASFRSAMPDICVLIVLNVLFFILSILFFVRYSVR
ncbi:ABC transporter permease [Candidatus Poribacteria bacterium]